MFKNYKDERINELIKSSFELAVKDSEWNVRYLQEWNILFEDIDKVLEYVKNGYRGQLKLDINMWYILQDTLVQILNLYDLELGGNDDLEHTKIEKKYNKDNILVKVFNIMEEYGWYFDDGDEEERYKAFVKIYHNHYNFIDSLCEYFVDNEYKSIDLNDISQQELEDMSSFMSDFLRALNEIR